MPLLAHAPPAAKPLLQLAVGLLTPNLNPLQVVANAAFKRAANTAVMHPCVPCCMADALRTHSVQRVEQEDCAQPRIELPEPPGLGDLRLWPPVMQNLVSRGAFIAQCLAQDTLLRVSDDVLEDCLRLHVRRRYTRRPALLPQAPQSSQLAWHAHVFTSPRAMLQKESPLDGPAAALQELLSAETDVSIKDTYNHLWFLNAMHSFAHNPGRDLLRFP